MKRKEFIDTLNALLKQELPPDKVEENVRYYDAYLLQQGSEQQQEQEIERIGHPNIIAQTIIDSYKMKGSYWFDDESEAYKAKSKDTSDQTENLNSNKAIPLLHKLKGILVSFTIIAIVLCLLRFAFSLFVRVGLPIIAIYLFIRLVKGMMGK